MPITTCVFDAYGTLLDVAAAARTLAARPEGARLAECWPQLAETWRAKQLEYTWLRATAGVHTDFRSVTRDGLDYAAETVGGLTEAEKTELMALYDRLEAYPEVPAMLAALKGRGLRTAILSNGSPEMLRSAADAAGIADRLDALISVEGCGVFKPNPRVYDLVGRQFGTCAQEVLFVSSNGWDAAAASGYGFRTLWVNRMGKPMDRLPWRPDRVAQDLTGVPAIAEAP
ncbi:haloacid dehalogenase type II [Rhodovulum sp. DZ06]|uniref:haloacid dehalogenase type II n=1 Tax=Rhodovulum sp. DZ06 TaxID=3425126 RepID=UPI003D349461